VSGTPGLRERKKAATRLALHEAALRLVAEHGLEHVTVESIADAADVSRRTFSNYFSSKEEALFHGDAERLRRMVELLRDRPADEEPWSALGTAAERLVGETYVDAADASWRARRALLRDHPGLVAHQVAVYTALENELSSELASRLAGADLELRSRVLAAGFLSALRVATQHWLDHPGDQLLGTVRAALAQAAPAASAGERLTRRTDG